MQKRRFPVLDIFIIFIICVLIMYFLDGKKSDILAFYSDFPIYDISEINKMKSRANKIDLKDTIKEKKKRDKKILRKFKWVDPGRVKRETFFFILEKAIKEEIKSFGINPMISHPLYRKNKGFKVIGRRDFFINKKIVEKTYFIIDYKQVYERNLKYFFDLTEALCVSADMLKGTDPMPKFLAFVQNIRFKKPPDYYKGKFINNFFTPLLCIYEQYGDCDSKSILLAEFLGSVQDSKEKTAIVLVRGNGLSHALLAVNRKPLPGMTSLFDYKKGYFIIIETSSPGWAPGFISKRIVDTIKSGFFRMIELN
jgi:hypothetical protein